MVGKKVKQNPKVHKVGLTASAQRTRQLKLRTQPRNLIPTMRIALSTHLIAASHAISKSHSEMGIPSMADLVVP